MTPPSPGLAGPPQALQEFVCGAKRYALCRYSRVVRTGPEVQPDPVLIRFPVFVSLLILLSISTASAQPGFECVERTGENATIIIPSRSHPKSGDQEIKPGDVIGVFTPAGLCAGSVRWTGKNVALTVWGNNSMTGEVDGFRPGEPFHFRVLKNRQAKDVNLVVVSATGRATYEADAVYDVITAGVHLNVRVLLEGPYSSAGGLMTTDLSERRLLPLDQPYGNEPWGYQGLERTRRGFLVSNRTIVDWVLVELRADAESTTAVSRRAAFIQNDGRIIDLDGGSSLRFSGVAPGSYYVVVDHRNHLAVMSSQPVDLSSGTGSWDFTACKERVHGENAMQALDDGQYALYAGDGDGDGRIDVGDLIAWMANNGRPPGYHDTDFTLSGTSIASDYLLLLRNLGIASPVP